jgi:hypothetical protein
VCVCVFCEREGSVECCPRVHLNVSKATMTTTNLPVTCVISDREREKNTAAKDTASVATRFPLYSREMTRRWKILLVPNFFSY